MGGRGSAMPHELIDGHGMYQPVAFGVRHNRLLEKIPGGLHAERLMKLDTRNIGWHGNALLVKRHIGVIDVCAIDLPTLEPRGAVLAELLVGDRPLRVIGMHLDLSGLWRRRQMRRSCAHRRRRQKMPTVLMGDTNEWRDAGGCLKDLDGNTRWPPTGPASTPAARSPRSTGSSPIELGIEAAGVQPARPRAKPRTTSHLGAGLPPLGPSSRPSFFFSPPLDR